MQNLGLFDIAFIAGLLPPAAGDIVIDGTNLNGSNNAGLSEGDDFASIVNLGSAGGTLAAVVSGAGVIEFNATDQSIRFADDGASSEYLTIPDIGNTDPWIVGMRIRFNNNSGGNIIELDADGSTALTNQLDAWGAGIGRLLFSATGGGGGFPLPAPPSQQFANGTIYNVFFGWDGTNRFMEYGGAAGTTASAYRAPTDRLGRRCNMDIFAYARNSYANETMIRDFIASF